MNKLAQGFMFVVILLGFVLALTPIIGSYILSGDDRTVIKGKDDAVKFALSKWFNAPKSVFVDVHALQQNDQGKRVFRFSFSTLPEIVHSFIKARQLEQKELTATDMKEIFEDKTIPWWSPEALDRKTWFTAQHENKTLNLIYNAKTQRAVLVIK